MYASSMVDFDVVLIKAVNVFVNVSPISATSICANDAFSVSTSISPATIRFDSKYFIKALSASKLPILASLASNSSVDI